MSIVILISVSTLFVKHHYIAHVVIGGGLGAIVCLAIDVIWEGRTESCSLAKGF
jgi:membrane-associated phospholipid phosphatase